MPFCFLSANLQTLCKSDDTLIMQYGLPYHRIDSFTQFFTRFESEGRAFQAPSLYPQTLGLRPILGGRLFKAKNFRILEFQCAAQ